MPCATAKKLLGVVKWFDIKKGFGFIAGDNKVDYFVHYTGVLNNRDGFRFLKDLQRVEFEEEKNPPRGVRAVNVKVV